MIFNWKDYSDWEKEFGYFLRSIMPSDFSSKIKVFADDIYCDFAGPFEELIHDEYDYGFFDDEFSNYFKGTYSHILTYHGCRPTNIQSYYQNGMLTLDKSKQNKYFSDIFLNDQFEEVTREDVEFAINEMKKEDRENQLFLGLDDRTLIETAGHYLIYGSEYIMCLAARLSEKLGNNYQENLRAIGTPTIFKVKLPVAETENDDIINLFPELYRMWIYNNIKNKNTSVGLDYSFFLKNNITSECIIDHYHPDEIRDYHNKAKIYIRKSNSYRMDDLSTV